MITPYFGLLQKLTRRTEALSHILKKEEKGKIAEVLNNDYMSSEESGDESDLEQQQLCVKTLSWESKELKKAKRKLDDLYSKRQSKHSQRRVKKRVRGTEKDFLRPKPEDCPKWACIED